MLNYTTNILLTLHIFGFYSFSVLFFYWLIIIRTWYIALVGLNLYVDKTDLKLVIFLPLLPECCNYRHMLPFPESVINCKNDNIYHLLKDFQMSQANLDWIIRPYLKCKLMYIKCKYPGYLLLITCIEYIFHAFNCRIWVSLNLKWVICRQGIIECCFCFLNSD